MAGLSPFEIGTLAFSGLGGAFGGAAQAQATKQQTKLQENQFNRQYAERLKQILEMQPIRDKVLYMLNQRAGMTPSAVRPFDMFNSTSPGPGQASLGGIDLNALKSAAGAYKPGMGGVDPSLENTLLYQMGYAHDPHGIGGNPNQTYAATGSPEYRKNVRDPQQAQQWLSTHPNGLLSEALRKAGYR